MSQNVQTVISEWLNANKLVFQFREDQGEFELLELASQKKYRLNPKNVQKHRLKAHPGGMGQYLNLVLDSGAEIVLCHAGLAFSPAFHNTGPINGAPPAVCMMDYYQLYNTLIDFLEKEEHLDH